LPVRIEPGKKKRAVVFSGDLTISQMGAVADSLRAAAGEPPAVEIVLSEVTEADLAFWQLLLAYGHMFAEKGVPVTVKGIRGVDALETPLRLTGLYHHIEEWCVDGY